MHPNIHVRAHRVERARSSGDIGAVNTIHEENACKVNRGPYIRSHTAMLRTTTYTKSLTARFGANVAVVSCATVSGLGSATTVLNRSNAGP